MTEPLKVGERVEICLDSKFGEHAGWYSGVIARIDPYSEHRNFYWVQLDNDAQTILKTYEISVFNPRNIRRTT